MYGKRLSGYGSIGYKARGESFTESETDIIFDKNNFWPVFTNDLVGATNEIIIVSPHVTKRTVSNILQYFSAAIVNEVRVTVVTKHPETSSGRGYAALEQTLKMLKHAGVNTVFKTSIHQKFAVIDQRLAWYGSINLLGFGSAEENIMRLESPSIAGALLASISKSNSATPIN
jgi:phosphatidylserine/phosphatidylglycerophosphate/cardiolipin synthase-like enzyme